MLRTVFFLLILVPGFFAALRNRYAALVMYLWFALFRPQDWVWVDITAFRVSLVLGAVLVLPGIMNGLFPNLTHPLSLGAILLVCSSLVTQTAAVRPSIGWIQIDIFARLVLASLMLVTLTSSVKRFVGVVAVIAASLGFHAAKAGLAFILTGGTTRFDQGLAGQFVDNNGYALGTVMIMPLLVVTAQNLEILYSGRWLTWIRYGLLLAVPLCVFTVIGTYSRGGFLALAAAGLAFILLQRRRFTTLAGVGAAVALFLLIAPIPQSYLDRLETIRTYHQIGEESALSRPHFWRVGLRMVQAHPLGVGFKQYEAAYDEFDFSFGRYGHHRAVHNSHVQVLAETGYFGAGVWLALFSFAFWACLRVRMRSRSESLDPETRRFLMTTANGLLVSMAGFVVGGSFISLAYNDITWLTFGMVAALDRLSMQLCHESSLAPASEPDAAVPLAFRVVASYTPAGAARI